MRARDWWRAPAPWPVLAVLVITLAVAAFGAGRYTWAGWTRMPCWPDRCFCEAGRLGPIAQPSNTYSNLGFVLVGLLIVAAVGRAPSTAAPEAAPRNVMRARREYGWLYGVSVVAIGLGSLFYHGSLTRVGNWFDLMGMYLFASFVVLYNWTRLRPMPHVLFAALYVAVNAALGVVLVVNPSIRTKIFSGLIYAGLAVEVLVRLVRRPAVQGRYLYGALGALLTAYAIWTLDKNGALCAPESWLQGHAAWHLLTAAAAGLLFLYYRSETVRT